MDRLLGLRPEERGTVGLAVSAAFLAAAGLMIAASSIDALVFSRYGVEKLPGLYLLLGVTMFVASLGVSSLLARLGRGRAFVLIPIAIAVLAGGARLALAGGVGWIYPVLWLLRGASEFLLGLAVWGLAGLVTDTRQAKRYFPLIGGGTVLGQVVGGLATKPLAAWIGADNLLLVWMGALAAVVVLGRILADRAGGRLETPRRRDSSAIGEMLDGLRYVRRSPLLRWLAVGSILASTLFFSLYLPFSRAATARYPDPEELAGFFGLFFALSTAITLLLSLVVMNRVLSRVGVPSVMLVLPLLYLLAFGVLTIHSTFAIIAVFRFAQVVWLQGGASSAWEAAINTVPADRRDRTRAFLYGGPTQVGTVIAGLVALVGERAVSPRVLYGIGLVSAAAALYAMSRVRRAYASELVVALKEGRPHVFGAPHRGVPIGPAGADRAAVSVVADAMNDPEVATRRLAAELLGELDAPEATSALLRGIHDADPAVRSTALRALAATGSAVDPGEIAVRVDDESPEVRRAALQALRALTGDPTPARRLLSDRDKLVRADAAALLLEHGRDAEAEEALLTLTAAREPAARAAALRALTAARAAGSGHLALEALSDPAASVRAQAARSAALLDPDGCVESLVAAMGDESEEVIEAVAEALAEIGEAAIPSVRRFAAGSVEKALASGRPARSIEPGGGERRALLRDSLLARAEGHALAAIRAAALLGDRSAIGTAVESLSVADPAQRANALEVLETLGEREVVRPLLALWEPDRPLARDARWLERLLHDPDDWIRACARFASAEPAPGSLDDARDDARGGSMTETMTTLPLMERVLFLRKVPLFADLPPRDLQPIAEVATEHTYEEGDTIAEQGEPGDEMHIIVAGYVMVILREPGGHLRVLAVRSAGEVIGEMAVITSEPRMAALAARGPVRLLTIGRRQFEAILRERPETSLAVMRVLCQRLADREAAVSE